MKVKNLFRILTPPLFAVALCAAAPGLACAQERDAPAAPAAPRRAEKFDEFGDLRHCDMSARLDNFAITMQNDPQAKAFVVGYDPKGKTRGYASRELKVARHYLVNVRGLAPERVVAVDGGEKEIPEGMTQLWVVPGGAQPPVAAPAVDKYAAKDFSGKFDSYFTDGRTYKLAQEVGYADSEIAYAEFAEKLKAQPESVGYLVVRAPADALSGDWRRVGRRDEQILTKDYGVEAGRLKTLNGGQSANVYAEVEFWILPKSAPPPAAGATAKPGKKPEAAFKLNTYDFYGSEETDKEAAQWALENLAEMLRDDPQLSGYLIVREPAEPIVFDEDEAAVEGSAPSPVAEETPQAKEAGAVAKAAEPEAEAVEISTKELAEQWKKTLSEKYGIKAHRINILEGRRMWMSSGRLTTWVVPEKAQSPDPLARDTDEPEEETEESLDSTDRTGVNTAAATPPRSER